MKMEVSKQVHSLYFGLVTLGAAVHPPTEDLHDFANEGRDILTSTFYAN